MMRLYAYGAAALAIIAGIGGAYLAYERWQDGVKQVAWQAGYDQAHGELTTILQAERAAVQGERDRSAAAARKAEQDHKAALDAVAAQGVQDKAHALENADHIADGLRAGTERMRKQWLTCKASIGHPGDTGTAPEPAGDDGLLHASVQRILGWVGALQAERDECVRGWAAVASKP
jgi:thioredoxin-like negative regulator of GroEL